LIKWSHAALNIRLSFDWSEPAFGNNAIQTAHMGISSVTLSKSALFYGILWPVKRRGLPIVPIEYPHAAVLILVNHSIRDDYDWHCRYTDSFCRQQQVFRS